MAAFRMPSSITASLGRMSRVLMCSICVLAIGMGGLAVADDDDDDDDRGDVHKVECGEDDDSIQEELDDARAGDTVRVSGTCAESITMRTDWVTLDCKTLANASITGSGGAGSTVRVIARNVVVKNCTIARGDSTINTVSIARGGSAEVTDNLLDGASVTQNSYGRFTGNEITGATGTGLVVTRGSYADVFDNNIHDNGTNGVVATGASGMSVVDNIITGHSGTRRAGVMVINGSMARFTDIVFGSAPNVITGNSRGIACFSNSNLDFGGGGGVAQGAAGDNTADFLTSIDCSVNPGGFDPFP